MSQLSSLGEFGLIDRLQARLPVRSAEIVRGLGDDAAVLRLPPDAEVVVTKDLLIEEVHFRRAWTTPRYLGWKALAVNLSDLAAMGATPVAAFVGLALPADTEVEWIDELYTGMDALAQEFTLTIAGGDTTASNAGLVISVTALGHVANGQALLRSGAQIGDAVVVTGRLGEASLGLALCQRNRASDSQAAHFHLPYPRLREIHAARGVAEIHSVIDLSDGLAGDAAHVARASRVTIELMEKELPLSPEFRATCSKLGLSPQELALHGGEDYELLMTVEATRAPAVVAAVEATGTRATIIGTVVLKGEHAVVLVTEAGVRQPLRRGGHDHFRA